MREREGSAKRANEGRYRLTLGAIAATGMKSTAENLRALVIILAALGSNCCSRSWCAWSSISSFEGGVGAALEDGAGAAFDSEGVV